MAPYSAPKPMSWTRWIPPSSVSNQAKTTAAPNSPPKEAAAKSPARTLKAIRFLFEPGAATSGAPASRSPASISTSSRMFAAHTLTLASFSIQGGWHHLSGGSQHLPLEQRERTRLNDEGGRVRRGGRRLYRRISRNRVKRQVTPGRQAPPEARQPVGAPNPSVLEPSSPSWDLPASSLGRTAWSLSLPLRPGLSTGRDRSGAQRRPFERSVS